MIRINLLPVKAARRRESGQRQVLAGIVVVLATVAGVVLFHGWAAAQLTGQRQKLQKVRDEIDGLKREVGDFDELKRQRDDLHRQQEAIKKLEQSRTGPVRVMRELSDILTKGKGPTFDKAQYEELLRRDPNAGFNQGWEPRRAWIISYTEKAGHVQIKGGAKSDEDVAEFLKRLKLSAYFEDVYWQQTQPQVDPKANVSYVTFDVDCRVDY